MIVQFYSCHSNFPSNIKFCSSAKVKDKIFANKKQENLLVFRRIRKIAKSDY